jgi:predicted RNase H-like HicB family nuclease
MENFEILIYWSNEDDCFVAEIPELPGCMAHGDSDMEALQNINKAKMLWIKTAKEDGVEIPKPKGKLMFA